VTPALPSPDEYGSWLIGTWELLRCEPPVEIQPGTRMMFLADHRLEYAIPAADATLSVTLHWSLSNGVLRTAHDDGSNAVEVAATHGAGDVLTFDFGGPRAWFVRAM
jgi:hypothetical protein